MAKSKRETIIATLKDTLEASVPWPVYRSLTVALDKSVNACIVIDWLREQEAERTSGDKNRVELTIRISAYVAEIENAEQSADEIIVASHASVMADRTIGGMCEVITPNGAIKKVEEHAKRMVAIAQEYTITYRRSVTSLTN